MTVLPQIILLFDKLIDKTKFKVKLPEEPEETAAGAVQEQQEQLPENSEDSTMQNKDTFMDYQLVEQDLLMKLVIMVRCIVMVIGIQILQTQN